MTVYCKHFIIVTPNTARRSFGNVNALSAGRAYYRSYRSLPLGGSLTSLTRDHPAAVTPSLYVTDTVCVGHVYPDIALP